MTGPNDKPIEPVVMDSVYIEERRLMRAVVQRVSRAKVTVDGRSTARSARCLVLLGCRVNDSEADADYLVDKIMNLRIFEDPDGKMNLSLLISRANCSSFRNLRYTATRGGDDGRRLSSRSA